MKIFELAKELDMGAIDLVEMLKEKGFNVRNHMASLSDDEVDKVRADLKAAAAPEPAKTKKKVTRKKAAKKKVTKKKVVRKSKTDSPAEEAPAVEAASEDEASKKTVTRKKKVIRKKAGEEVEENSSETLAAKLGGETASEEKVAEDTSGGLRVVSRPEAKKVEEAPVTESAKEEKEEVYREKVHKFTPVFIPEKKDEPEEQTTTSQEGGGETGEEGEKKTGDKKRLGGLASMMSGKKTNINRSQALNQQRADSELKSYAQLSGTGRPMYTQVKKKRTYSGPSKGTNITEVKDSKRIIKLHGGGSAQDIARKLKVKLKEFVDKCLDLNLLVKGDDYIGMNLANQIASLYGYRAEDVSFDEDKMIGGEKLSDEEKEKLPLRDPIIAIMGHVDHGKTTLLDHIREAKVAAGEAGGITQHIGAYSVITKSGKKLTFLDTPGHAAFASMRQRGAHVTDIVILVVAADDGVMPQTKESVRFIQNADNPMIVAINKMDKEGVNPDRVKNELTEFGITPEEWGGTTQMVPISALKGDGVDELLEAIALQAEIMELRSDPKGNTDGVVIESKVEPGRGPVATILVQSGTLKKGDSIVVGESYGRARNLMDSSGKQVNTAGPSTPVQILGLNEAPSPGDSLNVVKNEREAKKIVQNRIDERKKLENVSTQSASATVSLEDFFGTAIADGEKKTLNVLVRTDVQGSFEAIKQSLQSLGTSEVEVKVLGGGVGPISDSDVQLAATANGFIFGFNMRPVTSARRLAEQQGVEVRTYSVIYELINDVTLALEGMLEPEFTEKYIGRVEVKETFVVPKIGTIAGSVVVDGSISVGCNIRLLRDGKIMHDGTLSSLKRFKDDVKEVKSGYECGVGLEGYNDIKVGDLFEAYIMEEKKRTLEDARKADENAEQPVL